MIWQEYTSSADAVSRLDGRWFREVKRACIIQRLHNPVTGLAEDNSFLSFKKQLTI
jgi:hypothetical protein